MEGLISVIVPVYNAEEYLSDCLCSLIRQTCRELEILVVDDGSEDRSAAVCMEWEKRDGRIRLLRKKNGGVSSARNLGLAEAKGEYIAFVDADDWIMPDMLERQRSLLERERADMVLDDYQEAGEAERDAFRKTCREQESGQAGKDRPGKEEKKTSEGSETDCLMMNAASYVENYLLQSCSRCWSILFRREAIGGIRFPEELTIGEDLLFVARLMPGIGRVLVERKKGYCYFVNRKGAMLSGFRPSYMDQISCWVLAGKALDAFGEGARQSVQVCRFQAALLTAGKLALLPPGIVKKSYGKELDACLEAAAESWELLGKRGRKRIPAGYLAKGILFRHAPFCYLRLYHCWKRKAAREKGKE